MPSFTLAIEGIPPEVTRMRAGGVYWLACDTAAAADALAVRLLTDARALRHAVVAALGRSPSGVLEALPADAGPDTCSPFRTSMGRLPPAFARLRSELARAARRDTGLCLVQLPANAVDALDDVALAEWSADLARWTEARNCVVALVCHGEAGAVVPRLGALNRAVSGVAQLYPHHQQLQYSVHYWGSEMGVVAHRDFGVAWDGQALRRVAPEALRPAVPVDADGSDARLYLAEAAVLEGAPPLSSAWRLFDNRSGLMARAMQASMATVLFSVRQSLEVDGLARALSRLRRERGPQLKLVVREIAPCLRYVDEHLLQACGANLVVHTDTPLPRFLTLLKSVQGQAWIGNLPDDLEEQISARHPPDVGGVVSARQFRRLALGMLRQGGAATEHVVLGLPVVAGLTPEQALRQCHVRRRGDLACAYRREVRLFLFACRRDGIEHALEHLFYLWREMFQGYRVLDEFGVAEMVDDMLDDPIDVPVFPPPLEEAKANAAAADAPLRPRRLNLGAWR